MDVNPSEGLSFLYFKTIVHTIVACLIKTDLVAPETCYKFSLCKLFLVKRILYRAFVAVDGSA